MEDLPEISVMVPVRNEESRLPNTLLKLKEQKYEGKINLVVVDDGSKDNTSSIAKEYTDHVITLPDRGFSALGRPELSNTHNAGFEYILDTLTNTEFIVVVGGDTTFDSTYFDHLVSKFKLDSNLYIAAGQMVGERNRKDEVRGSGRMFKVSLLKEAGGKLPHSYAWEPYLVQFAKFKGYGVETFYELNMYTDRESFSNVNWFNYGIGMKEMGYFFLYAWGRGIYHMFARKSPIRGIKLILGYTFGSVSEKYNVSIRKATKKEQSLKIRKLLLRF